jgi:ketosteroid isomerase-like protein
MTHPNEELLRSLYDAFSRRDTETIRGLLADDVVFHQPGRNPLSGDYEGVQAVLGLIGTLAERSGGTFRVDVHDVLGDQDHAVGLLRVSGQREGREVNVPVVHVFHVRDGKLAELWIHPLDQYAIDEFWA